jgi:hypothetical protein
MKDSTAKEKKHVEPETDTDLSEESAWLAEIRSALSPYWSARTAYSDKKRDKAA